MAHANRARTVAAAALLAAALASPGCLWAPELAGIRREIQAQMPDTPFHRQVELSLGRVTLSLARLAMAVIPSTREARAYLRDLSQVQVAVYDHGPISEADSMAAMPARLRSLVAQGWEAAVKVRDANQRVWLLYRAQDAAVHEVLIVVLDDEELVLVKARGRLGHLVEGALKEARGASRWLVTGAPARL